MTFTTVIAVGCTNFNFCAPLTLLPVYNDLLTSYLFMRLVDCEIQ